MQHLHELALAPQENALDARRRASMVVSAPEGYRTELSAVEEELSSYSEVSPTDFIARLLAQSAATRGLSRVFDELLLQSVRGNELYVTDAVGDVSALRGPMQRAPTFGVLRRHFRAGQVLGVVSADGRGGVTLSPPDDHVVKPTDALVVLAKDRGGARPSRRAAPPAQRGDAAVAAVKSSPRAKKSSPAVVQPAQRVVLLNWNPSMPDILKRLDEVSAEIKRADR